MTHLSIMVLPGTQTLPLFAAQANGAFARRGLAIEMKPAPNSEEQRRGLAEGRYQIVHGAADQCVALVDSGVDAIIVAGGDNGFNHLFVQPEISGLRELRGRTMVADVANTGWSFVLYEILRQHGLKRGDYAIREAGAPFRSDA
jgi:ABC-type nitrate/sulfonate/bicarbonate transport system substrate-binding protein